MRLLSSPARATEKLSAEIIFKARVTLLTQWLGEKWHSFWPFNEPLMLTRISYDGKRSQMKMSLHVLQAAE